LSSFKYLKKGLFLLIVFMLKRLLYTFYFLFTLILELNKIIIGLLDSLDLQIMCSLKKSLLC